MGSQGLLLLMEFKFLIMMTRPQNITVATLPAGNSNVLQPGHHYQKFKFHQQQEALAAHFDFTSFSAQPFLDSWPQLFLHQGCFGCDKFYKHRSGLNDEVICIKNDSDVKSNCT